MVINPAFFSFPTYKGVVTWPLLSQLHNKIKQYHFRPFLHSCFMIGQILAFSPSLSLPLFSFLFIHTM